LLETLVIRRVFVCRCLELAAKLLFSLLKGSTLCGNLGFSFLGSGQVGLGGLGGLPALLLFVFLEFVLSDLRFKGLKAGFSRFSLLGHLIFFLSFAFPGKTISV